MISKYSLSISHPIKFFLLVLIQASIVVPLPRKGSNMTCSSVDQERIWSIANCKGNTAGCLPNFFVLNPTEYFHILFRNEKSGIGLILLVGINSPSLLYCVLLPQLVCPAHLFGLSEINVQSCILPLQKNKHIFKNLCISLGVSSCRKRTAIFFIYHCVM